MRLIRLGPTGQEKPAVLVDKDRYVDVSDVVRDFDEDFFRAGGPALLGDVVAERIDSGATSALRGQRLGAPIGRPHQIICIGLNYSDHAAETGQPVPDEPIVFNKAPLRSRHSSSGSCCPKPNCYLTTGDLRAF